MHLSERIIELCSEFISSTRYVGIFVLMFAESTYFPVPSEAVMPFVGMVAWGLADEARKHGAPIDDALVFFWLGVVVAALGGLGGSLATYYFGRWAGPVGVRKWGRYAGLVEEDLDTTQRFFDRRGAITVFVARFVPVVRHFISTVAGIAKMKVVPFSIMTTTGAFLWDLVLASAGYRWGKDAQDMVHKFNTPADVVVVAVTLAFAFHLYRKLRARTSHTAEAPPSLADLDAKQGSP